MTITKKVIGEFGLTGAKSKFILEGMWRRGLYFTIPFVITFLTINLFTRRIEEFQPGLPFLAVLFVVCTLLFGWSAGLITWQKKHMPVATPCKDCDSPFTHEFFMLQYRHFYCMAYRDEQGRWRHAHDHSLLPEPLSILG